MAGIFVKKCPCLRPKIEEETRILDYRHSGLHDVPSEVFNLERTLEELYTDSNQIQDLPRELFYCHGLRKLSISDNEITSIPPAIASLANLEEFDFSKNGVIDVPDTIKGCKYLRSIDASVNPLGKLPEGFTQLANLTHLYLNDTFLDYLPGSFGRMVKLHILEIRENHLKTLPRSFSRLVSLERLDIGNNEFTEVSDVIGSLVNLLELWCDHNQITTVTSSIGNLKQLMFLDASKNQLQELPEELEGCVSLADLHLTGNHLLSLPDSIGNLSNLTTLKADDNQLTSLPKTLGGLSSLSELNVSTNDLEDLPASIGLLRNLRTFYADENMLQFVPAELGSCSGITVLSLRSNKLTYIPDELGRIPRLRVLNLSDNLLCYLPFTIVKLKELQALWLTENQTRPLIPLQSEYEEDTGRKILTCYLLPQGELLANDECDPTGDTSSFHASMWDEERLSRQQIHFDFADNSDEEGTLVRCPTPYPKEMREKVRHARNLAMRQMVNVTDSNGSGAVMDDVDGTLEHNSREPGTPSASRFDYSKIPNHSDVRIREARITKPTSPTLQASHRLYRYDKEKLMKDKARMQHRLSVPDINSEVAALIDEERSKRDKVDLSHHSGSVPDLSTPSLDKNDAAAYGSASSASASAYGDLYQRQFISQHRSRRTRRIRDYDSDTGYRSDVEVWFHHDAKRGEVRGDLENLSVKSQPLPFNHRQKHRQKDGNPYLENDLEFLGGAAHGTANAAVAAFQRKNYPNENDPNSQNHPRNSAPPSSSSHILHPPMTPRSEPRVLQAGAISSYDPCSISNSRTYNYPHSSHTTSSEVYNKHSQAESDISQNARSRFNPYESVNKEFLNSSSLSASHNPINSSLSSSHNSVTTNVTYSPLCSKVPPSSSNPSPHPSHTKVASGLPPPTAPKPNINNFKGSNYSLTRPASSSPSPPVFHRDNFLDQSTPVLSSAPVSLTNESSHPGQHAGQEGAVSLETVMEEKQPGAQKLMPKPSNGSQSSAQGTPPPYPSVPPYRRQGEVPNGRPNSRRSSDSSSQPMDSPRTSAISNLSNPSPLNTNPSINVSRSKSSPCGFHGNNPFSDLPSSKHREKLSFDDYADVDRLSHHSASVLHDSHTTRSGSSSSQIGSASQIGLPSHRTGGVTVRGINRDCSDSSDSRSDIHNRSSSRESPYPGGNRYGLAQTHSPHNRSFDPYSTHFDTGQGEELEMIPNQEQSSQVSSSTDSGYGHGHHVYERIGDFSNSNHRKDIQRGEVYSKQPGGSRNTSEASDPNENKRLSGEASSSRRLTPSRDYVTTDSTSQEHRDEFRVAIRKNPGLGFSIAGGIGSQGNPFRPKDPGIFVTKVNQDGPAAKILRSGDKILEVNNVDFQAIHHNQAVAILKNNNSVNLVVERVQKVNMV